MLLCGCASSPKSPPASPASQPSSLSRGPAHALATALARAAGIDQLPEVAEIDFRFAVIDGGERVFAADHHWDLSHDRARITWKGRDGKQYDALLDIGQKSAEGTIDGVTAKGDALKDLSEKAYARWINDTYWLMLPLKLLDPGVKLELVQPREWNGEKHQVLKLSFDNVGLTPGDVYWLYVNVEANRIVRWEMLLQGKNEIEAVTFENYHPVGPLLLAHDHVVEKTGRRIVIEDTRASKTIDATAFKLP